MASGLSLRFCPDLQTVVNASAQIFTWLEIRHVLAGQLHCIAGLGVAAHAGSTVVEGKTAEAADLYALVAHQCRGHSLNNHTHS